MWKPYRKRCERFVHKHNGKVISIDSILCFQCLEDKDAIVNFIAGSRDFHIQVIDMREDLLVKRARAWAVDLIAKLQS